MWCQGAYFSANAANSIADYSVAIDIQQQLAAVSRSIGVQTEKIWLH